MSIVKIDKLSGKNLCNIFDQKLLTKAERYGIIEDSARLDRQRAVDYIIFTIVCQEAK